MEKSSELYKTDFYRWKEQQKQHLINRQFDRLDLNNLVEEFDDMGKSEPRAIESHSTILLLHLLKYQYQTQILNPKLPEPYSCRSWLGSIDRARHDLLKILSDNPSLSNRTDELLKKAYPGAKKLAIKEMNRYLQPHQQLDSNSYPDSCPWIFEEIMGEDWLPS